MKRLLRAYRCARGQLPGRHMARWLCYPLGQRLLAQESAQLSGVLPTLFGYHLLQVGGYGGGELLSHSRISHHMVLEESGWSLPRPWCSGQPGRLRGSADQLPLASDSLDVVLLPHVLEFHEHPHQVLREVERTLIPEGHVVILGFNPFSLWGLTRALRGWQRQMPWCGQFRSSTRVRDWLALLCFDTVHAGNYFFRPPLHHSGVMERLSFIERIAQRWWPFLGGGYLLVARKRVATITPIRPRWQPRRRLVSGGLAEPTLHRDKN